ncbi:O-methyltransferase [Nostoc sp.]|uniref:O-methyltransferase n=1 Tax=Nostoc sp. TaxID=1180 RepID=UPI002FF85F87
MSDNPRLIHAEPTKDLFIYMLVRDIPLIRAIIDLVDNSVDGATHLQSNENYEGLWIKILVNEEYFQIQDNCGGITVNDAEEYAFKFGRANDAELTPKSIGRFGIGMKRAFFKIGKKFTVESTTSSSKFVVSEDVEEWKKKDEWTFEFSEVQEDSDYESNDIGTRILIEKLHENVSDDLGLENFISQLKQELTIAYSLKINKGLSISINDEVLSPTPLNFRTSDTIKVAKFEKEYNYFGSHEIDTPVQVRLYAGVSDRNLYEVLPTIEWNKKSIVWLDYDSPLDKTTLDDIDTLISKLVSGSVLIVTVSAEQERPQEEGLTRDQINKFREDKLRERLPNEKIPIGLKSNDLTGKDIGNLYKRIINNQLKQSVSNANSARSEDEKLNYKQIFDFRYADGCRMLTVGWLIFEQNYCNVAEQCKFSKNFHATELDNPYEINVPNLTPKEIQYLDSQMPTDDCNAGKGICIPSKDVKSYAELYKYFPSFVEMLM